MISVGFSYSTGFRGLLSKVIMWVTKRPYSHVWFLLEDDDAVRGVPMVLEASNEGGVHFIPWEGYKKGRVIVKVVTPPFPLDQGLDYVVKQLGENYDYTGLVGQGFVILLKRWFRVKIKNPLRSAHASWCSVLVLLGIQHSEGYDNAKKLDPEASDPGTVDDVLALQQVD